MFVWLIMLSAATPKVSGALNPEVTQSTIDTTICVKGYTSFIRPSTGYTNKLKLKQMSDLHLKGKPFDYEEDHLISLELGGNPTDPNNLWPEPWTGPNNARDKDRLENALHRAVCSKQITLFAAQKAIRTNWISAYRKFFKN